MDIIEVSRVEFRAHKSYHGPVSFFSLVVGHNDGLKSSQSELLRKERKFE